MSKSLRRVRAALEAAGVTVEILEPGETRTAEQAAAAADCHLDQIVKSIIFRGDSSGHVSLFLTAGGNRVCVEHASTLAGETLGRADAALVRAQTGFAIGGVAPIGLLAFDRVWAAAGTPRHIFSIDPQSLVALSGATVAEFTQ